MSGDLQRLLTGGGTFVDDIRLPGMLYAVFARSPHAHARIIGIDSREALTAPGVVAAITAHDLGSLNGPLPVRFVHPGLRRPQMPRLLADATVRHVGEPVALVLADGRYEAADAAAVLGVDYEPLAVAATVEQARSPGAPLVHDEAPGNVAGIYRWRVGNPDDAFLNAPVRLSVKLQISRGAAVPIETRGCVASYDPATNTLTMWASTQSPHYLQRIIARRLGLPERLVRVIAPDVGGAFGVKGGAPREYVLIACLAVRTGRPVKWVEGRQENFVACQQDREQTHHVDVAATRDGRLLAFRDRFAIDIGAYALYGSLIGFHTTAHLIGPYRLASLDVQFEAVHTHRVPTGAYRGAGRPQGTFVIERAVDQLAHVVDLDPATVRERNLIPPSAMPWRTGLRQPDGRLVEYDSGDYPRVLEVALDRFGYASWRAEQRRRRLQATEPLLGLGLAMYVQETAAHGSETVTLRMEPTGRVVMTAGPPSQGQRLVPVLSRVIGRELAIPAGWVDIATGDTAAMPESFGTHGSRVATVIGNAATQAARDLAARLRALAAEAIACRPDDIVLRDGRTVRRDDPRTGFGYAELLERLARTGASGSLEVSAGFEPEGAAWSSGAHLVALEIDRDTGDVRLLRYLVVHDSGAVLDEDAVRGQILGGLAQGLGGSLYERLIWDEAAQPIVTTLADYAVPRAAQLPPVEIIRIETPSPHNPLGLKGAGESGCMAAYAALASAVEDALDTARPSVTTLPLPSPQIWALMQSSPQRRS